VTESDTLPANPTHEQGSSIHEEGRGRPMHKLLSISQLVLELQADFPDLSISKVRYLEDRGLVTPERTKGRYRKYTRADVRTLHKILSMQRDEYLPLDVIRQRVDMPSAGSAGLAAYGGPTAATLMSLGREEPTYSQDDLCEALGVDAEFVLGLVEFRIIEPAADTEAAFTESDLETARICHRLARFQVEPRHLRVLSSSAEREAGLIEQVATPALRSGHADRKEHGLETVQELGTLFAQLMQLLLRKELRRIV
jgi:DNA-binding transcriptional MerR regulator